MEKLEWSDGRLKTQIGVPHSDPPELDLLRYAMDMDRECTATIRNPDIGQTVTNGWPLRNVQATLVNLVGPKGLDIKSIRGTSPPNSLTVRFSVRGLDFVRSFEWHCLKYDLLSLEIKTDAAVAS